MDSSIPDDGFALSIKSRETANQIIIKNSEDLQTARELLNYHTRKTLGQDLSCSDSKPAEIDIHPHVEIDSATTDQLKTTFQQLQTQVENTITADEINSFQDAFSQELEKLRDRINQLETNEPSHEEKWGLDKVKAADSDDESEDSESDTSEEDQNNGTTLEQFREHSVEERADKIYEVIKQHAPVKRTEVGQHLFDHEISSTDTEYKELCNSWPDKRVEVAGSDGQAKIYQPEEADEQGADDEDELDYPELELTGYNRDEFDDLTVTQRSEVIICTLLQHQPCTLDTVCNQIFQSGVEQPKDKFRHFLENYWQEIILNEDGEDSEYAVVPGVNYDPDTPSLSALANVWRTGQYWSCLDCDKTYKSRADAKQHRQDNGHLNWGFSTGGQLVEQYRENNRKQQTEAA
jgi:hypothetical protein